LKVIGAIAVNIPVLCKMWHPVWSIWICLCNLLPETSRSPWRCR